MLEGRPEKAVGLAAQKQMTSNIKFRFKSRGCELAASWRALNWKASHPQGVALVPKRNH